MLPDVGRVLRPSTAGLVLLACITTGGLGCNDGDEESRALALAAPASKQLVGEWKISLWVDQQPMPQERPTDTSAVHGTIVFAEDTYGRSSTAELDRPTHDGVYDIDFSRFGFTTGDLNTIPTVVAAISPHVARPESAIDQSVPADSIYIVLSPGTDWLSVRMSGHVRGDSASGIWSASTYRAGGSAGRFVMRRAQR